MGVLDLFILSLWLTGLFLGSVGVVCWEVECLEFSAGRVERQ